MKAQLLAPAGSPEALTAAVRAGADAVYLGLTEFNARRNAANFDDGAFFSAVEACHIRGVRVYLTLNTLLSDGELPRALAQARLACLAGADAVIVQDLGLAALLRRAAPELRLHASTQTSVHTPAALELLREMGFVRAVLARELSAPEIGALTERAHRLGMETEIFVHGAQCMSVSGQCYFSAVLGGRSGNRGLCAQPCRLPFANGFGAEHALSLRDLSLIRRVGELEALGVDALKIEGRMKRPEYVAAATAAFRGALDGAPDEELIARLGQVFSRSGHTDAYFTGRRGPELFGVRTQTDELASAEVTNALHALYRAERQRVPLSMRFTAAPDRPALLTVRDGAHTVSVEGPVPEPAVNRPLTEESARVQLEKLGGTVFLPGEFSAEIASGLSLPASALNRMRRAACEALEAQRRPRPKPFYEIEPENPADLPADSPAAPQGPARLYARFASPAQVPNELGGLAAAFLPAETDFAAQEDLLRRLRAAGVEPCAELPRGLFSLDDAAAGWLERAARAGLRRVLCENLGAVALARRAGLEPVGGFGLNLYNARSLAAARALGVGKATLSFELSLPALRRMAAPDTGVLAYGRLPLMLCRACPAKGDGSGCAACGGSAVLRDRRGTDFPVTCRSGCSEVLNSRPLYLADRLGEFGGFGFLLLRFSLESPQECARVIRAYAPDGARPSPPEEYTRGLYYRGLQ